MSVSVFRTISITVPSPLLRLFLLYVVEPEVDALLGHERLVSAHLRHHAVLYAHDRVGVTDRRQSMRNDDARTSFLCLVEGLLDDLER